MDFALGSVREGLGEVPTITRPEVPPLISDTLLLCGRFFSGPYQLSVCSCHAITPSNRLNPHEGPVTPHRLIIFSGLLS